MNNTTQLFTKLSMTPAIMPPLYAEILVSEQDLTIAIRPGQDLFVNVGDQYNYFAPATANSIAHIHLMNPLATTDSIRVWCDLLPANIRLHSAVESA
ncbi:hypothetical protein [Lacticaseibacillus porcinae]|uniref:hypothetical protein n=1 Tax=Lacticaseibacillus porcinae TaxID=1123687 RepID=UPI000F77D77C|nr:hypothetical protein [Lacticaseibacillus porcinae]